MKLSSRKMGIHEWSYKNDYNPVERRLVPHVASASASRRIARGRARLRRAAQTALEVQRCLNCDIQTVFTAPLCIECDACIDICPVDCLTITANGAEAELRDPAARAAARHPAGAVRFGGRSSRPPGSWSRTRTCACTAGCAPSAARPPPGTCRSRPSTFRTPVSTRPMPAERSVHAQDRLNDFVVKFANVNGTGSASANCAHHEGDLPQRHPGHRQELLPVEHPGPADLVRDPRHARRPRGPRRAGRPDAGDERARPMRATCARSRPGGYLLYDSTWPRRHLLARDDITVLGVPFARLCNERFDGVRDAHPDEEHLLRGRGRRAARPRPRRHPHAGHRAVREEAASSSTANMTAIAARLRLRQGAPPCPLPFQVARLDAHRRPHPDRWQHRGGARLRVRRRDCRCVVSDHAVDLAHGRLQGLLRAAAGRHGDRRQELRRSCRPRTSSPRSAW